MPTNITNTMNKTFSAALALSLSGLLLNYANAQNLHRRLPCEASCAHDNDEKMSQGEAIGIGATVGSIFLCICCCIFCARSRRDTPSAPPVQTIRNPLLSAEPSSQGLFAATSLQMTSPVASQASSRAPSIDHNGDAQARKRLGSDVDADEGLSMNSASAAYIV